MIVASSREAAVTYKKELDKLNGALSKVILTCKLGEKGLEGESWDRFYLTDEQKEGRNILQESRRFHSNSYSRGYASRDGSEGVIQLATTLEDLRSSCDSKIRISQFRFFGNVLDNAISGL